MSNSDSNTPSPIAAFSAVVERHEAEMEAIESGIDYAVPEAATEPSEAALRAIADDDNAVEAREERAAQQSLERTVRDACAVADQQQDSGADNAHPASSSLNVVEPRIGHVPPPRRIIYDGYIKGFLTGIAGTGGTGKTSLTDVEAVSMAIGKDLFNDRRPIKAGPQKVLVMSLEDAGDEYQRRLEALTRHYRLTDDEITMFHENVVTIMGLDHTQKLVTQVSGGYARNGRVIDEISALVKQRGIDVITVDPLTSAHEVQEDTGGMQQIASILRSFAQDLDVAVHFTHHNRKGDGNSGDDMRGAVSLRDAARRIRMLTRMTQTEAEQFGIPAEEFPYYVGQFDGKNNLNVPSAVKRWYRMASIDLDNNEEKWDSDVIGVTTYIGYLKSKDPLDNITPEQAKKAMDAVAAMPIEKRRASSQAQEWIGVPIARTLGIDLTENGAKKSVNQMINAWKNCGVLVEDQSIKNPQGKLQPTLKYSGVEFS